MDEPITMNKVIHGAFRRDLDRFDRALAQFPAGDRTRAAKLGKAWTYFFGELDHHHHGEHDIAWPALRSVGVSDDLLAEMDAEHGRLAESLELTDAAFGALQADPSAANAKAAQAAVTSLQSVADTHMSHEEAQLEHVYFDKRDTEEIKAMSRKFAKRNPVSAGDFFAWVANGATERERTALRESVPPPVLAIFGNVFGQRYRRVIAPVWKA